MNNKVALVLAILIAGLFAADAFYLDWNLPVFLGKKLSELSQWLAFWR